MGEVSRASGVRTSPKRTRANPAARSSLAAGNTSPARSSPSRGSVCARQRLEEALAALRAGGPDGLDAFTRRERATAYGGSQGLPIREEIVLEREDLDVVVTRNGYGALCLNSTRAMFVDVDPPNSRVVYVGCLGALVGVVAGVGAALWLVNMKPLLGALVGMVIAGVASIAVQRVRERRNLQMRDPVQWALEQSRAWVERYEQIARDYASCRLVETVGDGAIDIRVEPIRRLHDEMCRATSSLKLA